MTERNASVIAELARRAELQRSDDDRLLASLPTAASLLAASALWDRYAPSHLRGLLRCQVVQQPEAPPAAVATEGPFAAATRGAVAALASGLALFGLAQRSRVDDPNIVVFYSPDQPRASDGKWTDEGKGSYAGWGGASGLPVRNSVGVKRTPLFGRAIATATTTTATPEIDEYTGMYKHPPTFEQAVQATRDAHPDWFDAKGIATPEHQSHVLTAIMDTMEPPELHAPKPKPVATLPPEQPDPWDEIVARAQGEWAEEDKKPRKPVVPEIPMMLRPPGKTTPDGKPVPDLPGPFSDDTQGALDADKWLRKNLGIKSAQITHPKIARYALPLLRHMYAQGLPMPGFVGELTDEPNTVAQYVSGVDSLYFNPACDFWSMTPEKQAHAMDIKHKQGWFSTGDVSHVAVHEIAHELHDKFIQQQGGTYDVPTRFGNLAQQQVAHRVSRYAGDQPGEFVAETFTGIAFGNTYDAEVMKMYRKYHGPPQKWSAGLATYSARTAQFGYNPQEARDETGEWTTGGATSAHVAGAAGSSTQGYAGIRDAVPAADEVNGLAAREYPAMTADEVRGAYKDWAKGLNDDQFSLAEYYQQSGFDGFNRHLRQNTPGYPLMEINPSQETGSYFEMDEGIEALQSALLKAQAPTDMRLYRGGRVPQGIKPGDVVQDDGFVSTSMDRHMSEDFVTGYNPDVNSLMEIDIPKGSAAASLDAATEAGGTQQFDQSEMLLPHGATFAFIGYGPEAFRGKPVQRFVYLGPMTRQPDMAHFSAGQQVAPGGQDKPNRFMWQDGDLRIIGNYNRVSFAYDPTEPRIPGGPGGGEWTSGGYSGGAAGTIKISPKDLEEGQTGQIGAKTAPTAKTGVKPKDGQPRSASIRASTPRLYGGTVESAEKAVRGLGIGSVDFANNRVAATVILPALQAVQARNLPVPATIYASHAGGLVGNAVAAYIGGTDSLVLNLDNPFWDSEESMIAYTKKQTDTNWWVKGGPITLALHELGHAVAEKGGGQTYKYGANQWRGGKGAEVAMQVSRYAATRPHEFVAETFAGLMLGQTYSVPVMALYKAQGGVVPEEYKAERLTQGDVDDPNQGNLADEQVSAGERRTLHDAYEKRTGKKWDQGAIDAGMNDMYERMAKEKADKEAAAAEAERAARVAAKKKKPEKRTLELQALLKAGPLPKPFDGTVAQAKGVMREAGIGFVSVQCEEDQALYVAGMVIPVLQKMHDAVVSMPRRLTIGSGKGVMNKSAVAAYGTLTDTLFINTDNSYWNPKKTATALMAEAATGYWSAGTWLHPVIHEIGHKLNADAVGDLSEFNGPKFEAWGGRPNTMGTKGYDGRPGGGAVRDVSIAMKVSRYAGENPAEFVAEVFAGSLEGKEYDDEVMEMYKYYQGPDVNDRNLKGVRFMGAAKFVVRPRGVAAWAW
jgi:hypothetical protein